MRALPPTSQIENPKNLPLGSQDPKANSSNALQFLLENSEDDDKEFVKMMHLAILEGLFVYLGNGQIQITQLGYLFLSFKPNEEAKI